MAWMSAEASRESEVARSNHISIMESPSSPTLRFAKRDYLNMRISSRSAPGMWTCLVCALQSQHRRT